MKNRAILLKLIEHIDKIQSYCKDNSYESFLKNSQLVEACVFNLSQMGEMVNRLDDEFIEKHNDIPWHQIRGLRNRIIHDYEGVNLYLVWEVIKNNLPNLRDTLIKI